MFQVADAGEEELQRRNPDNAGQTDWEQQEMDGN